MPSLLAKLNEYDPKWRENISPDPLEAAVEIGLLEPEDIDDDPEYKPLDFNRD